MGFFRSRQIYLVEVKATGQIYAGLPKSIARAMDKSPSHVHWWINNIKDGKYENSNVIVRSALLILHGNKKK